MVSRKQNKKARRKTGSTQVAKMHWSIISPTKITKLPYYSRYVLVEAASGSGAYYTFGLNRLYDPDVTGTGLQPTGFDQLTALYNKFRVLRTSFRITFVNLSAGTSSVQANVGYFVTQSSVFPSSIYSWPIQRLGKWKTLPVVVACVPADMQDGYNMWDVAGVPKTVYMNDLSYVGSSTSDPTNQNFVHIWAAGVGGIASVVMSIELQYEVEWSEPVALQTS
jgi:hypothetical protein